MDPRFQTLLSYAFSSLTVVIFSLLMARMFYVAYRYTVPLIIGMALIVRYWQKTKATNLG